MNTKNDHIVKSFVLDIAKVCPEYITLYWGVGTDKLHQDCEQFHLDIMHVHIGMTVGRFIGMS